MPPEQRLSSAAGTRAAVPQAAPMFGWLSASLGLGSAPVGDLSAPHSSHVSDVKGGSGHSCPQAGLTPLGQSLLIPAGPWDPLYTAVPNFFIFNFTQNNLVLKCE